MRKLRKKHMNFENSVEAYRCVCSCSCGCPCQDHTGQGWQLTANMRQSNSSSAHNSRSQSVAGPGNPWVVM